MAKPRPVPASEFTRNFGRYRLIAQRGAVEVTSHGHVTGYFVPAEEYQEFLRFKAQRRTFATADLSDDEVRTIGKSRMHRRHDHLNSLMDRK
jgi:hypothetical protein